MLVLGRAGPSQITRPRVCPRMVSTTAWQSAPAVNPGPTAMTAGASVMRVPRFFLARMASTSTSGRRVSRHRHWGSARTGISPPVRMDSTWDSDAARAVTSSTVVWPRRMAWEKQTVRRMAVGRSRSVMTTEKPARYSRRAIPEAISPAPRMRTSIKIPPYSARRITQGNNRAGNSGQLLAQLKDLSSKVMTV